ncbi:MAG: hypothetical protein NTY36_11860 [Deltaproteobacteria bacterium]|nr:hypothetical protein [Deltaproteobacteria bacterium]
MNDRGVIVSLGAGLFLAGAGGERLTGKEAELSLNHTLADNLPGKSFRANKAKG